MQDTATFFAFAALILTPISYVPYFVSIYRGTTKPHAFSWLVWGILTGIAFFAQIAAGGGAGAWVTGLTAFFCFVIVIIAWVKKDNASITRSDWISFCTALGALPLWWLTANPLYAVLLITLIDALAFYPTFRKTWQRPDEESLVTYALCAIKFMFGVLALETFNLTTALYPASLVVMNFVFVVTALWRRHKLRTISALPYPG